MYLNNIYLIVILFLLKKNENSFVSSTPVVLWHGMGDTCCLPFSLGYVKKLIESEINGTYVKSIEIGGSIIRDYESGFFIHPNKQIEEACRIVQSDPELIQGYNAIGFSQGGQFLRGLAQRCPSPPMKNLITMGGQHQGVYGLPNCPSLSHKTCEYFRELLNHAAYHDWVQDFLVQATYWHDPIQEELYANKSTFMADINNEKIINNDYIDNLQKLEKFVMVKFKDDTIVQPKESQWFEFYKKGQDKEIVPLSESELYLQDKLGLQQMMNEDKLIFLESPGNHLAFTKKWFIDNIVPYLRPYESFT